jgi:Zn-dependent M16 (insulinase) family peptidase
MPDFMEIIVEVRVLFLYNQKYCKRKEWRYGMEHEEEIGLESLNGLVTSELKWYVFDLIMERLKLDKIDECRYSIEKEEKDRTSFYIKDGTILVSGKDGGDLKVYENLYLAVCDFFNRVYQDEARTEEAISRFLTRTLDLPILMKKPSRSLLQEQIKECEERIAALDEQLQKEDVKSLRSKRKLDGIYLEGLKAKLSGLH